MPTGFTSEVAERDDFTFQDFVWKCVRAFGAFMHMRDESSDAELTMPKQSDYYQQSIDKHKKELARLKNMTLGEAEVECAKEYAEHLKTALEGIQKKKDTKRRYEAMLEQVNSWRPPSLEHDNFKSFMREQLTRSIEFDCDGDFYEDMLKRKQKTPKQWLKEAIEEEEDSLKYAEERYRKEKEGIDNSIKWITDLQNSVPMPKKKVKK